MSEPSLHMPSDSEPLLHAESPRSALEALRASEQWERANAQEREVLERIAQQRDRVHASKQARAQAKALRAQQRQTVSPDAPLAERITTFARLHPVATAAVAGVALYIGPRRLLKLGLAVMPFISKSKR